MEDAYRSFLLGIRKTSTTTVKPEVFDMIFNDAAYEWMKSKLPLAEFNQKRIDDLENFRVVTDGTTYPVITGTNNVFTVPNTSNALSATGDLMSGEYPLYLHGLNVMFNDGEDFWAKIMRSDQRALSTWNPYRKITHERPFYELINGKIRLMGRDADYLRLEYVRWFRVASYVNSIDPEFKPEQNSEIIDIAVRIFLENRMDPRYKSKLQELMIRSQAN